MIDYLQAGEIRAKYPKNLSREDIDKIINIWFSHGLSDGVGMSYFACYIGDEKDMNLSELELYLRAIAHFEFNMLEPLKEVNKEFYGPLAITIFKNELVGYNNVFEIKGDTYDLRIKIGTEFLDKCQALDAKELSNAFKTQIKIYKKVTRNMKKTYNWVVAPHPYKKRLDKVINRYIL